MTKRVEGRIALRFPDHEDALAAAHDLCQVLDDHLEDSVEVVAVDLVQVTEDAVPDGE